MIFWPSRITKSRTGFALCCAAGARKNVLTTSFGKENRFVWSLFDLFCGSPTLVVMC